MNKLTKIVATIGPSSESEERVRELITLGVNVFRFNLKHNTLEWHGALIDEVRRISKDMGIPVGILIDMQGPEIRITVPGDQFEINTGDEVKLVKEAKEGEKSFSISHPDVIQYLKKGQTVIVDDGKFKFEVKDSTPARATLISESTGVFKNRKSLNLPGVYFPLPVITDRDRAAIEMGKKHSVDFVALSFVRQAKDIAELREEMKKQGLDAWVISKIETKMAIDNLDEIINSSDGLMVARGDLGIELPMEQVPFYQKLMIRKCIEHGIPVITATQMLESMIEAPLATRAEISDIANAVYDFTDATMLSGETAFGKYPERVIETMSRTISFTEKRMIKDTRLEYKHKIVDQEEMVCDGAYSLSLRLAEQDENTVGGFIVFTQTGRTARKLSRYRGQLPIYAFTQSENVYGTLTLNYGVLPILHPNVFRPQEQVTKEDILKALEHLKEKGHYDAHKYYIVLHGDMWMIEGKTSTIKIISPQQ